MAKHKIDLEIYPNPPYGSIQIIGIEGSVNFKLFDLSGELVMAHELFANEFISVDHLTEGVYIIGITSLKGSFEKKLIMR